MIDTLYNEIRALLIGKYYTSEDLAFYTKGAQFPQYAVENINSSMNSVLLPVLSNKQDDYSAVKMASKKVIRHSSYIIWPLMVGLCAVSSKFIMILLTEKWLPASVYLQILCFNQVLQPLQTTNLSVIKALGRADIHLKLEIIKKAVAFIIVVISALIGVKAIAIGSVVYAVIASIINSYPNRKLINYSYAEQLLDIMPFALMSGVMGIIVYCVGLLPLSLGVSFAFQVFTGIIIYILMSVLSKNKEFKYFTNLAKGILLKRK